MKQVEINRKVLVEALNKAKADKDKNVTNLYESVKDKKALEELNDTEKKANTKVN